MEQHFAVIGYPIAHSLSPQMHRAGYRELGLLAEYSRFAVEPGRLSDAVKGLKALGFSGWNVTLPHKESIIPLLDELTPEAQRAGAVNTVRRDGEKLIGHNTDGRGFTRFVENELGQFQGKKAVLLGAGGAAKGIALSLAERGMTLQILNRTSKKAEDLARSIRKWGGEAIHGSLTPGPWLSDVDLLVQTTSLGLHGESFPLSLAGLSRDALVVDIIFNPWETSLLYEAKLLGCRTFNGLEMLLQQGALAWEFWLGGEAPREAMRQGLLEGIGR
ncbi:MAG: shikimate dehydrogenase [Desulfitobacteriaceae bacterium]